MQNTWLDILILGLLVLLFGSIYRTRPTPRLRYWIIGWLCVLAHFGILLINPATATGAALVGSLGLSTLLMSAVSFMLAADRKWLGPKLGFLYCSLLALPAVLYIFAVQFQVEKVAVLIGLALAAEVAVVVAARQLWFHHQPVQKAALVSAAGAVLWIAYSVVHGQAWIGIYAFLTQFFLMNAMLYWQDFKRWSMGVITAVGGLVTWAAVFPSALLLAAFFPHHAVPGELWNIPKFFVEFGMILTLLEGEIIVTSRQREEYRVLFDGNPHPMWITDFDTLAFLKVNDSAVLHYGYTQDEFLAMTLRDIRLPEDVAELEHRLKNVTETTSISGPWIHLRKDGSQIQVEIASHRIDFEGRKARFSLAQDITERQLLHERLLHQANHDALTGLPNRLLLKDRMEQTLASAARRGNLAAVICLDLDRFKQINDTYGHVIGDLCLKKLAERLCSRLRASDTVARSGGEEFTVLLDGLSSSADAELVVAELLTGIRQPFAVDGYNLEISASIGIAIYPDDGTDSQVLWRSADTAMYKAKNSGGNQYLFVSNEISASASEASEIEICMRRALKEGSFEVYYQPQYTIDGYLYGLEALLRLHDSVEGMIPPNRFIPIAEESGLIVPIGNWVLEEICRQSAEWQCQGLPPIRIALNVSPLQFMRADFAIQVRAVLAAFQMDPGLIELEMTETTVMRKLDEIARQMLDLSGLGVHFSVDDFGTGYSSLRHLHQLPIKTLKIDRSFIERISDPNGTYAIVQAILSLAHSLEMQVVAEGVERQEQVEILRELKCDAIQGFLWGRPQPARFIPGLISSRISAFPQTTLVDRLRVEDRQQSIS
ncbi:MAG TPA: EAL domain-containing protein [Silvibacterium sp.]|nr:EAL domain-containing protein [Silvibacterium sp.]